MHAFRTLTSSRPRRWFAPALLVVLLAAGCSEKEGDGGVDAAQRRVDSAEEAVAEAEVALDAAGTQFCEETRTYIAAIDRYGKAFDDEAATVGDIRTLGADLGRPRESTVQAGQAVLDARGELDAANQELVEARAALDEAKGKSKQGNKSPTPSEPAAAQSSVDRVKTAEDDLEAASSGITDETPLSEAKEEFTSAAFALEVAWINLLADAGCLTDDQAAQAAAALQAYTVALQTELQKAGYLKGDVDGVYGPETVAAVEALQTEADLPVTGLVDLATRAALDDAVSRKGESAADDELVTATSIQTVLKLAGFWPGEIDGKWTPELEAALKEFQKELGVEQTGAVDAATLAAFEELLVELQTEPTAESSPSPTKSR